ncbi:NADH:ubiquinone reductase (Na(+)-transporting) subunit F [Candidatus Hydrogenedentota bacterium]
MDITVLIQSVGVFTGLLLILSAVLIVAEKLLVNYGICKVDINAEERVIELEGGQTLLSTLYESKVFIPSACGGKGTCGFCKVRVLTGGGPVLPTETPYLTRKEIRSHTRLACQVKVKEDMEIRIPEELLNVKMFDATVKSNISMTYDIKETRFSLNEPAEIKQRPGQYIQIQAPSPEGPVFRAYSISSASYDTNEVELNVRLIPNGIASTYIHGLEEGDKVIFVGPYGEFVLNQDPEVEIVCVGGGAGMAPMKNIILSIYDKWPDRTCWFFFGCRSTKDVFYYDEFKELAKKHPNFHVVYALSEPGEDDGDWDGETGFVHLPVDKMLDAGVERQAFLCGPPLMIEAVTHVLEEKGVKDIFYDKF